VVGFVMRGTEVSGILGETAEMKTASFVNKATFGELVGRRAHRSRRRLKQSAVRVMVDNFSCTVVKALLVPLVAPASLPLCATSTATRRVSGYLVSK